MFEYFLTTICLVLIIYLKYSKPLIGVELECERQGCTSDNFSIASASTKFLPHQRVFLGQRNKKKTLQELRGYTQKYHIKNKSCCKRYLAII